jgi:glycosyltransferase involved in cell wall biosynthesis
MSGVVIVSPGGRAGGGGMGTVTRLVSEWLQNSGSQASVQVVDPRGDGSTWLFPFYLMVALFQILWARIWNGADILHLQVSERGSFLRKGVILLLGKSLGMKTILHHHGAELITFFQSASPSIQRFTAWIARLADLNIVLGLHWKSFIVEKMHVSPDKVVVLYNATTDKPRAQAVFNDGSNLPHLLLMANLSKRKGVSEFLQSVARIKNDGQHLKVTISGGGSIAHYKAEAAALGIDDVCRFTGWLDPEAAHGMLLSADALVLPSYDEGLPMVILEALSAGVPVVATPVGSIPDVLKDEVSCLFVTPGSVDELSVALMRVLKDSELRSRLSRNGREIYLENFNLDDYMRKLLQLYAAA